MKEATGELTGTVIVTSAVAVLTIFFFTYLWPMVKTGFNHKATCADAVCDIGYNENFMAWCYNPTDDDKEIFECPFRG